jgi:hypothetical protein
MSPVSGLGNVSEPMLTSQFREVGASTCGSRPVFFYNQRGGYASILLLS